jgi:hypothetical protein
MDLSWETDFQAAAAKAEKEGKAILVYFKKPG